MVPMLMPVVPMPMLMLMVPMVPIVPMLMKRRARTTKCCHHCTFFGYVAKLKFSAVYCHPLPLSVF